MKLLVTGGGGFIGSHFAEAYSRQGDEVIALDNLSRGHLLGRSDRHAHYTSNEFKSVANVALVKGVCSIAHLCGRSLAPPTQSCMPWPRRR